MNIRLANQSSTGLEFLWSCHILLNFRASHVTVGFWCHAIHKKLLRRFDTRFQTKMMMKIYAKYLCDDNSRSKKHWNILSLCMSATGALFVSIWPRLQKSEEKRPRDCPLSSFLLNGVYWVNCLWGYRPPSPTNTTYFLDDPLYWNYSNIP